MQAVKSLLMLPLALVVLSMNLLAAETESPAATDKKKVVFLAGKPSHGYGAHEHRAGSLLLAGQLNKHVGDRLAAEVHVAKDWPGNAAVIEDADAIVFYCDGGKKHMANDSFCTVVLNAITWVAQAEVPEVGVPSDPVTEADLEENQDFPKPGTKK